MKTSLLGTTLRMPDGAGNQFIGKVVAAFASGEDLWVVIVTDKGQFKENWVANCQEVSA